MKGLLTPHRVALAIGVSESSLKRWCDRGVIPVVRTPGGHRRIPIQGVLEFLRTGQHKLVRPEVLGLPAITGKGARVVERAAEHLLAALSSSAEDRVRQILFDVYLAGHPLSAICDRIVAPAFHELGSGWNCGAVAIYQERFGCELVENVLRELRETLPLPGEERPLAIGGTPGGDIYRLPTRMVELVLRGAGWRARSLGTNLPFPSLVEAIAELRPRLFWLSVSNIDDGEAFLAGYATLCAAASDAGGRVVVGGRALDETLRQALRDAAFGENMQHLETLAGGLCSSPARSNEDDGDDAPRPL